MISFSLCVLNFVSSACSKPKISRINNSFLITPWTQALNYLSRCHLRKLPGWEFSHRLSVLLKTCIRPCNSSHLPNSCRWKVGMTLYRSKIYSSSRMAVSTGSPLIQSIAILFHPESSQNRWGGYFRAALRAPLLDCRSVVCTRSMLV